MADWDSVPFASGNTITYTMWNGMVGDIKKYWPLSSASDLNSFNSANWHNSSLMWSNATKKWNAKPSSGTGGASNLSDLTIDADKDWDSKSIYNMTSISSDTISRFIKS